MAVKPRPGIVSGPPPERIALTPGKRVLFLTKDPELIRAPARAASSTCAMEDVTRRGPARRHQHRRDDAGVGVLRPPARGHRARTRTPASIVDGAARCSATRALMDGNFEVIVSGQRKGVGSLARDRGAGEKWSGIRLAIAASFAPIHERNNINLGQLMGDHAHARAPPARRGDPARGVHARATTRSRALDPRERRALPVLRGARARARSRVPPPATRAAADDDGREDPRARTSSAPAQGEAT